jgi:hypothetical protein
MTGRSGRKLLVEDLQLALSPDEADLGTHSQPEGFAATAPRAGPLGPRTT